MKRDFTGDEPLGAASPGASAARLREETRSLAGLAAVMVEERIHPLWLRAGTNDAERAIAMLDLAASGLKCPHEPRRIVELGAGCGYRSVALASEYPGAEILAAEADRALRRTGLLNTLSYDNITYLTAAVSDEEMQFGYGARRDPGGVPALEADEAGGIRSRKLLQLLSRHGFYDADMLVVTPDAASARLLCTPLPSAFRLIAVETGGAPLPAQIARHYPLAQFVTVISGNYVLLHRRAAVRLPAIPRPLAVLAADGPARYFRLDDVAEGGFFHLPGGGVRLHPNARGRPPARLTLSAELRDHAELQLALRVMNELSGPVCFTVRLVGDTGGILACGSEVLRGGAPRAFTLGLPPHQGRCEVVFSTEMAEPGLSPAGAWAEIVSATLV